MNFPSISVLILSYNHEAYIERCLLSVEENRSNFYDLEVVIIDDGSTDGTIQKIEKFILNSELTIRFYKSKHEGVDAIARNFNKLVDLAIGDYICFLSSDDEYLPDRFVGQLSLMQKDVNLVLCYSNGIEFREGFAHKVVHSPEVVEILNQKSPEDMLTYITKNIPDLFIQAVLVRSSFIKSFKAFDEYLIADDWVFNILVFSRIHEVDLKFEYLPVPVFVRNIHGSNTSRNVDVHYTRVSQVIEKYCKSDVVLKNIAAFSSSLQYARQRNFRKALSYLGHIEANLSGIAGLLSWIYRLTKRRVMSMLRIGGKALK